jgi:Phosphotransacetylase
LKHILTPNLPKGRVESVLLGRPLDITIISNLKNRGIEVIEIEPFESLDGAVASHADLLYHHLGGNLIITSQIHAEASKRLADLDFVVLKAQTNVRSPYPHDVALDAARVADALICNPVHTDSFLLEFAKERQLEVIPVKQGYAKCSVCIIDEKAIITADSGIAKAARNKGIDVLQIQTGYIELKGYEYGFIGGCCGKTSPDTICFTGDLQTHPDHIQMISFMKSHGACAVSLCEGPLVDIGGILPLTEAD